MGITYVLGGIIGIAAVCFVEFLLFYAIVSSIVKRKQLPYEIHILKYSIVSALIFGVIGSTIFSAHLIGQLLMGMILVAAILWGATFF